MTNITEERPWGSFTILYDGEDCKVKTLIINPDQEISYQFHYKRQEEWTVISGTGTLTLDDEKIKVQPGDHVTILPLQKHTIRSDENTSLKIIEVQTGTYFGEDDIVRITDKYGRA